MRLEVLYQDDHLIAIDKPPGIHVHPTHLSKGEDSCMRILRDQIGQWVYPVHRLDRATSGVLLFALDKDSAAKTMQQFIDRKIKKRYWAVVRGYVSSEININHPLKEEPHKPPADATTIVKPLAKVELPFPIGSFTTARYSLVEANPVTGRKNQVRKHFVHISHPIVGDVRYGDGKHNRLFREQFSIKRLLLMAMGIELIQPATDNTISIKAPLPDAVKTLFLRIGWESFLDNKTAI